MTKLHLNHLIPNWQTLLDESQELQSAAALVSLLEANGFEAYIVGGAVRDMLLGRPVKDVDIVTNARPEQILALEDLQQASFKDTAQAYAVTRVHFHGKMFEVATFRRDINAHQGRKATEVAYATLSEDLQRRDFTINAIALRAGTNEIVDEVGGLADLEAKYICFIGDPARRIQEDTLRIIRAVRFKAVLGFQYEAATYEALQRAVAEGKGEAIARDRLRMELTSMLVSPARRAAIIELDKLGILERILPEITAGKGVEQPRRYHAEGDVWQHQLETMNMLPPHPSAQLAWAALLHDIGKAKTRQGEGEAATFHEHYSVGAEMARALLKRLHFSKKDVEAIVWMIDHHMNIDDLPNMRRSKQLEMLGHPAFADLLALHKADAAASWPGRKRTQPVFFPQLEALWHDYQTIPYEQRQPSLKHDVGIDGRWLQQEWGPIAGQRLGRILADLKEWYHDTGITDIEAYRRKVDELMQQYK